MKNALVTGGSRGIGLAVVDELKKQGYNVYNPSRKEMNLLDNESIMSYMESLKDVTFDILVNNAGINDVELIEDVTLKCIEDTIQINTIAPVLITKSVVPNMKRQNYGRIVNIGSIWDTVSKPGRITYAISKHGIHGLTQSLAVELAKFNILVNTISPGFTLTELTKKNNSSIEIKEISKEIPIERMADPKEQAKVICFFSSSDNSYITGQNILVDGGFSIK